MFLMQPAKRAVYKAAGSSRHDVSWQAWIGPLPRREERNMSEDILGDRRNALEEEFFAKHNRQLAEQLRETTAAKAKQEALAAASGITDAAVLEQLAAVDLSSETLAALSLVPLVEVGWADGRLDAKERSALLAAAAQAGVSKDSAGYQLLEEWFREQPSPKLFAAWKAYVAALSRTLDVQAKQALKQDLLGRARAVAEAAGGFLGLGKRISSAEQAVLTELEQAFA
jgi:hypothetical protein